MLPEEIRIISLGMRQWLYAQTIKTLKERIHSGEAIKLEAYHPTYTFQVTSCSKWKVRVKILSDNPCDVLPTVYEVYNKEVESVTDLVQSFIDSNTAEDLHTLVCTGSPYYFGGTLKSTTVRWRCYLTAINANQVTYVWKVLGMSGSTTATYDLKSPKRIVNTQEYLLVLDLVKLVGKRCHIHYGKVTPASDGAYRLSAILPILHPDKLATCSFTLVSIDEVHYKRITSVVAGPATVNYEEAKRMDKKLREQENYTIAKATLNKMKKDGARISISSLRDKLTIERNGIATEPHHQIIKSFECSKDTFTVYLETKSGSAKWRIEVAPDQITTYYPLDELCPNIYQRRNKHDEFRQFVSTVTKEQLRTAANCPVTVLEIHDRYIKYSIPLHGTYYLLDPLYKQDKSIKIPDTLFGLPLYQVPWDKGFIVEDSFAPTTMFYKLFSNFGPNIYRPKSPYSKEQVLSFIEADILAHKNISELMTPSSSMERCIQPTSIRYIITEFCYEPLLHVYDVVGKVKYAGCEYSWADFKLRICANKFNPSMPRGKFYRANAGATPKETTVEKAVRSNDADGTAYHLISPIALARLAATYREGSNKYGDFNWTKGFPIGECINHALRHINYYLAGDRSEDHLAHAAWNLFIVMHFEATHPELKLHVFTDKAKEILDAIQAPKVEKHAADTNADPAVPV